MKRKITMLAGVCLILANAALASKNVAPLPATLANARYVYVTAYDGDQFDPNLLSDDRVAIARVQSAIQKWGKLIVVYRPEDADIVIAVESRPSEDVLAVYDARTSPEIYLWRVMARGGLQKGETPLVSQFQQAFEKIAH